MLAFDVPSHDVVGAVEERDPHAVRRELARDRGADDAGADHRRRRTARPTARSPRRPSRRPRHGSAPSRSAASSADAAARTTAAGPVASTASASDSDGSSAEPRRAPRRRAPWRPVTRTPRPGLCSRSACACMSRRDAGQAAVDPQRGQRLPGVGGDRGDQLDDLRGDPVDERAHQMTRLGLQPQPVQRCRARRRATTVRRARPAPARRSRRRRPAPARRPRRGRRRRPARRGRPASAPPTRPCTPARRGSTSACRRAATRRTRSAPTSSARATAPVVGEQERAGAVRALRRARGQAALAEQGGLLVDEQPGQRQRRRPNAVVVPTAPATSTTLGSSSPSSPKTPSASADQAQASRSSSIVRDAVEASVTNAPVSACTSHASRRRDHAVAGDVLAQPGHLRRGEVRVEGEPGERRQPVARTGPGGRRRPAERRSCQTTAGLSGSPEPRSHASTVSPWFASPTASTGSPAAASAARPAVDDRGKQVAGVLLDHPVVAVRRAHVDLRGPEHLARRRDHERLRAGRALVDREHGQSHASGR